MGNIKALVVGVSKYRIVENKDLPFCKNDIIEISNVFIERLGITKNNIITLGMEDIVTSDTFMKTIKELNDFKEDDTFLFYFSGHGYRDDDNHYLVFSDKLVSTQSIIDFIEELSCKNKIIFMDCCFAGKFNISEKQKIDTENVFLSFDEKGCTVLASSSEYQESFSLKGNSISRFTSILSEALKNEYIVKKGELSLRSIHKYISLRMDRLNKIYANNIQYPILRSNILGDIYFKVENYSPYIKKKVFQEHDDYIIYEVEPSHIGVTKRYSVKVILKDKFSHEDISRISSEVFDIVKSVEVYNSEIGENKFRRKNVNIIWLYFGKDESDILNNTYMCKTTWIDKYQNKDNWYSVNDKNKFFINDVHIEIYDNYEVLKSYRAKNSTTKEKIVPQVKEILSNMINISEEIISCYSEYENKKISECKLFEIIGNVDSHMDENYHRIVNLDFPPDEIQDWFSKCIGLVSTIHNFKIYWNRSRTEENRKQCMDMNIQHYYKDLKEVISLSKGI